MTYMGPGPTAGPQPGPQGPYPAAQGPSGPRHPHRHRGYRSLFWAFVLIAAGVVWLLSTFDMLTSANIAMLSVLWPILLVGIGLDMLVGRRSLALGALVGVVTVGLIIVLMLVGPGLGWADNADVKTQTFTAPVGQATSAQVDIETGGFSGSVHALPPGTGSDRPLMSATVDYTGSMKYQADTNGAAGTVTLAAEGHFLGWHWLRTKDLKPWDVGLDPSLPLSLTLGTSSGSLDLDASTLTLTGVQVDVSSGDAKLVLPAGAQSYKIGLEVSSGDLEAAVAAGAKADVAVRLSSGDVELTLGADSDVQLAFSGSSGDFHLRLAAGQAYRIEVKSLSSGDVHKPGGLVEVSKGEHGKGIWQTEGYDTAAHKVVVTVELSSGDVTIEQ